MGVKLGGQVCNWRNCNGSDCMKLLTNTKGQWVGDTGWQDQN